MRNALSLQSARAWAGTGPWPGLEASFNEVPQQAYLIRNAQCAQTQAAYFLNATPLAKHLGVRLNSVGLNWIGWHSWHGGCDRALPRALASFTA